MKETSMFRKWQLTINNPLDHDLSHDQIKILLDEFKNIVYWCMSDEIGENGTYHTHLYLVLKNGVRFRTVKDRFPSAHIEIVKGTSKENLEYVTKTGKWKDNNKSETSVDNTFECFGELPLEEQGKRNDIDTLYQMIKDGYDNYQILEESPSYLLRVEKIDRARQIIRQKKFSDIFRKLEVVYIYGDSGIGKTRFIMDGYGYKNVYRVTDYQNPFDQYDGQDVIIFDEFRSSLRVEQMLNYIDGYPLQLPCRYNNKTACFTKVFIISNISLEHQYTDLQRYHPETWQAFLRRIHMIITYNPFGQVVYSRDEYFERNMVIEWERIAGF